MASANAVNAVSAASGLQSVPFVQLRLHSGIPVVEVQGDWEPSTTDALSEMIRTLSNAGHYDIVVNVQKAALKSLNGIAALRSLAEAALTIRSHCGHLDFVGTVEQIDLMIQQQVEQLFRPASSEESAIGRIKRVPMLTIMAAGVLCTARPLT